MKRLLFLIGFLPFALIQCDSDPRSASERRLDERVDSVLALMTLDEKIGQMTLFTSDMDQTGAFLRPEYIEDIQAGKVGAIFNAYGAAYTRRLQEMAVTQTRLGIPLLFGYDVIHGHRTIFPMPLAEASSWDMAWIRKAAQVAAAEATAEGLHWTFAPMVDVARDPRWGRIIEGSGEDPYLGSRIAAERVIGFQGDDLMALNTMAATVKHFVAYGAAQAGRDYHSVDMSERRLRETYLPPFKAAIDAGAVSIMTAFNDYNGKPASASRFLMTDILRKEWGFTGFIVTDYTAIMELQPHGVASDPAHASELALNAGVDMSMQDGYFNLTMADLVKQGRVPERDIDTAVRRILRVKFQLGLFDDPYRYSDEEREKAEVMKPENIQAAREMAQRSIVLLKNDNQALPLSDQIRRIAVVGPLSEGRRELIGSWSAAGDWTKSVTLLEGIRNRVPNAVVTHADGCDIVCEDDAGFAKAVQTARNADVVVLALGEAYWMSGEAASRSDIGLPGRQRDLAEAILKTGKPVVVVLMNGRPLTIDWLDAAAPAILETWFLGTTSGDAIADVLFGDYNPSGKLPVTFPRNVGQIPIYHSALPTGRPFKAEDKYTTKYLDVPNEPLYVFGHGLSYTTFAYSDLTLSANRILPSEPLTVTVTVTNTGSRAGEDVVQLYLRDRIGSLSRPLRELKGFEKISLEPGESRQVTFAITIDQLSFHKEDLSFGWELGEFEVHVGGNSRDTLMGLFEAVGSRQ
jgi:beta-glucosidase